MKIFVVHDAKGDVKSAGISGPAFAGQVYLVPQKGQLVSEIDVPDMPGVSLEMIDEEAGARHLLDLVQNHRVDVKSKVPRLIPK